MGTRVISSPMLLNRRQLLGAGITLGSVALLPGLARADAPDPQQGGVKSPAAQNFFALMLNGQFAGWLVGFEGGDPYGEVVTEAGGAGAFSPKHLGRVRFNDLILRFSTGMGKELYEWIASTFAHQSQRKSGSVLVCNSQLNVVSRLDFQNALITEVMLPELDGASKDTAVLTVKLTPEAARYSNADGRRLAVPVAARKAKRWTPAFFRLAIDGLDSAGPAVARVDRLGFTQKVATNAVGELRDFERTPGKIEISNLAFEVMENRANDLRQWFEEFVLKGNSSQERNGTLEYLGPDLKEVLFTIKFKNLGIFKLTPDKGVLQSDRLRRVRAELYCEDMTFAYSPGAAFG